MSALITLVFVSCWQMASVFVYVCARESCHVFMFHMSYNAGKWPHCPLALQSLIPLWQGNDHPDREDKPIVLTDGCPHSSWWKDFMTDIETNSKIGGWGVKTMCRALHSFHTANDTHFINTHQILRGVKRCSIFKKCQVLASQFFLYISRGLLRVAVMFDILIFDWLSLR